jgi:hypothetical protein
MSNSPGFATVQGAEIGKRDTRGDLCSHSTGGHRGVMLLLFSLTSSEGVGQVAYKRHRIYLWLTTLAHASYEFKKMLLKRV